MGFIVYIVAVVPALGVLLMPSLKSTFVACGVFLAGYALLIVSAMQDDNAFGVIAGALGIMLITLFAAFSKFVLVFFYRALKPRIGR